jgi:hypothetical protein
MTKNFDPLDLDHVKAYRHLCLTGAWPVEHDITERTTEPIWIVIVQSRLCEAYVDGLLGPMQIPGTLEGENDEMLARQPRGDQKDE